MFNNLFLFPRTIFFSFWHTDWGGAFQRRGFFGTLGEFFSSLTGLNTWPFFIDSAGDWNKSRIQNLLGQYWIPLWGWGHSGRQYYFRVKKNQAHWAQYILLENGAPVGGRLLKGSFSPNTHTGHNSNPQHNPNEGANKNTLKTGQPKRTRLDPISEINRWADKLGGL